jgi:hypothetical protein
MITLQFATENSILSYLIRRWTWSEFSHVDIVINADSPSEMLLGARLKGGVLMRKPNYAKFSRIARYTWDCSKKVERDFYAFAFAQIDKPYDWRAIVNFAFHHRHNWKETDSWFCSEYVLACSYAAQAPLVVLPDYDRGTPRDLTLATDLRLFQPHVEGASA